jgi:pimeloyl-ACP methyl ester carboxylesterase
MTGTRAGVPVFLHHGTPGSRNGPKPRASVLYRLGVWLIAYDRPGYGGSTRQEGRSIADAAADVEDIADSLGIDRFSVVGRSGGGPHALACAALLGDRVARTTVLVSLAPPDARNLDWMKGMVASNVDGYSAAATDRDILIEMLRARAAEVRVNPNIMIEQLRAEMTDADKVIVDNPAMRKLLAATYREGLVNGPFGWYDDVLALGRPWQFDPARITGPVQVWHGAEDNFAPVSHSRWLARQVTQVEIVIVPKTAHFGAIEVLPDLIPWLIGWTTPLGA